MKTITTTVYTFDELSEKAKEKAIDAYRNHTQESFTVIDFWETCQAINKIFPINIRSLDATWWRGTDYTIEDYEYDKDGNELSDFGYTFDEYIKRTKYPNSNDNMQLTGTYSDIAFLESLPRWKSLTREDFKDAMRAIQKSLEEAYDDELSDESIAETIRINEYDFLEDWTKY